jgi:hypothetical protein
MPHLPPAFNATKPPAASTQRLMPGPLATVAQKQNQVDQLLAQFAQFEASGALAQHARSVINTQAARATFNRGLKMAA